MININVAMGGARHFSSRHFVALSSTPSDTGGSTETVDGQESSKTYDLSVAI